MPFEPGVSFPVMPVRLVHHTAESIDGGISPFAAELSRIADGGTVDIACPFLNVPYIEGLLTQCPSWRILTDAQEFLSASRDRRAVLAFISRNRHRIRHLRGLHAKVVIGADVALVGSANLTESGLAHRDEMAVLFDGKKEINKLRAWFEDLWGHSVDVKEDELRKLADRLPIESTERPEGLPSTTRRVNANLSNPKPVATQLSSVAAVRLVDKLRKAPSQQWAEHYLDLVRELLETTGLDNDDPRLVMSVPDGPGLPVTICQRYVLAAFRHGPSTLSMMLPGDPVVASGLHVVRTGNGFAPKKDETKATAPWWIAFKVDDPFDVPERVKEPWRRLVRRELDHGRSSSYRAHHDPVVFEAAMNVGFRGRVLDEAFGRNG